MTAASADAASSVHVSWSTSASTGVAPAPTMPVIVATQVFAAVITSSPGADPSARSASAIASVPEFSPTACATPQYAANSASNPSSAGPPRNRPRAEHGRERVVELGALRLGAAAEVEERDVAHQYAAPCSR